MKRPIAIEIDEDDAARLSERELPPGVQIVVEDEVEFWGRTYSETSSGLLIPAQGDAAERAVDRFIAELEPPRRPIGIDLFCGAGGFSLGVEQAGFDVVAASEWDVHAAITYLLNLGHPDCKIEFADAAAREQWAKHFRKLAAKSKKKGERDLNSEAWIGTGYRGAVRETGRGGPYGDDAPNDYIRELEDPHDYDPEGGCRAFFFGDIAKVSGQQMLDAAGVSEIDLLFGGPPCQGLSTASSKACLEDPRNALIWEFMRLVLEIRPKSFMIENVPPILTVAKGALFNAIAQLANDAGYNVVAQKLNAADFGVPQIRVRAIIVGTRADAPRFSFPMPHTWALGRPVEGEPWSMVRGATGEGDDDEAEPANKLPPHAHFDLATRTWSFTAEEGEEKEARKPKREEQQQLEFGDTPTEEER